MPLVDAKRRLDAFEWACAAIMAVALAMRVWRVFHPDLVDDGARYATMAVSFDRYGEFLEPWLGPGAYSQHYPPLFPLLLAATFGVFGASLASYAVAEAFCGLLLVAVALLTTWDLYGRRRGFAVAAVMAGMSFFLVSEASGLTESLVAASFAVTIWAILRSLTQPRFILVAGLAAAVGYLTKSSVGPFFVVAGLAGFLWRFSYMRWAVFRERSYLAAAAIFGAVVLLWAGRNVLRHGWPNWETQPYATDSVRYLFREAPWWSILPAMTLWSFAVLAILALPFLLPGFRDAARRWREEPTSALWMAVATPTVVASLFAAAFFANEHQTEILSPNIVRYVLVCVVPLLWIGMRGIDLDPPADASAPTQGAQRVRRRAWLAALGAALVVAGFLLRGSPGHLFVSVLFGSPLFAVASPGAAALLVAGLALLLASRAFEWAPQTRVDAKGARSWRAVPAGAAAGPIALAILLFLFGIWFGTFYFWDAAPFFVAAAVGLLLRGWRERAVASAAILLAASLSMSGVSVPFDAMGKETGARMAPGESVALLGAEPSFLWPFLPEGASYTLDADHATWLVDDRYLGDAPPAGYETVAHWQAQRWHMPGAQLAIALGFVPEPQGDPGSYYLYHRAQSS